MRLDQVEVNEYSIRQARKYQESLSDVVLVAGRSGAVGGRWSLGRGQERMAAASSTWTDKSHGRKRRLGFKCGQRTRTGVTKGSTNKDKKRDEVRGFPFDKKGRGGTRDNKYTGRGGD